jgi:hypothetical protein
MKYFLLIVFLCSFTVGLFGQNVGIGVSSPTNTLDVNGSFRLRGGSPAAGSQLISTNSGGTTSWNAPVAFLARGVTAGSATISYQQDKTIVFPNETYDLGNDYNPETGIFTAPVDGVYHFSGSILWNNPGKSQGFVAISLFAGVGSLQASTRTAAVNYTAPSTALSIALRLSAGTGIRITAYQSVESNVSETIVSSNAGNWFSGYLVYRTF